VTFGPAQNLLLSPASALPSNQDSKQLKNIDETNALLFEKFVCKLAAELSHFRMPQIDERSSPEAVGLAAAACLSPIDHAVLLTLTRVTASALQAVIRDMNAL